VISLLPSAEGKQTNVLPNRTKVHVVPSHVTPSLKFSQGAPWVLDAILEGLYEGWNFNSGNYLFTTDTK